MIQDVIQRIPWSLAAIWIAWIVATGALVKYTLHQVRPEGPSLQTRLKTLEERVALENEEAARRDALHDVKIDAILRAVRNIRPVQIGTLALPNPAPEKKVDWRTAMADAAGVSDVRNVDPAQMSQLFETVDDPLALVNLVSTGQVTIERLVLHNPHHSGPKTPNRKYLVLLTLRNMVSSPLRAVIPKGQVFENVAPRSGFQNLVAVDTQSVDLAPNVSTSIQVQTYCFNEGKDAPVDQAANISPLRVKFEFDDQVTLWRRTTEIVGQRDLN